MHNQPKIIEKPIDGKPVMYKDSHGYYFIPKDGLPTYIPNKYDDLLEFVKEELVSKVVVRS